MDFRTPILFPEVRYSVEKKIPLSMISVSNLPSDKMIKYVLLGRLPEIEIISFAEEVINLYSYEEFVNLDSDERREYLIRSYPNFARWADDASVGLDSWIRVIGEEFEKQPSEFTKLASLVSSFDLRGVAGDLVDNFKVRKYKLKGVTKGNIETLFDSLGITDKCRQIVFVNPLQDKVLYKLSNTFGDKFTKIHSQRQLLDVPSRRNVKNSYIGMTFNKNKISNKVVTVFIDERVSVNEFDESDLEIVFENLEDADGEVVLNYFKQALIGSKFKSQIENIKFEVYDVELKTSQYNQSYVRQALIDLSSNPVLRKFLSSESRMYIDDQRFALRDLAGKFRSKADFQEKFIVFSSESLFDVFNLVSLFLGYAFDKPSINILSIADKFEKDRRRGDMEGIEGRGDEREIVMDVIVDREGEQVLKRVRFFDSIYRKVCNKPENVPSYWKLGSIPESVKQELEIGSEESDSFEDKVARSLKYEFFPSRKLINSLKTSGYIFPKYESQRALIQIIYGETTIGKKKKGVVKVLGRRAIPRERKDEMATSILTTEEDDNLAYILGYFPCVINMDKDKYNSNKQAIKEQVYFEMESEEGEQTTTEYIYDETKNEIPVGRKARTQAGFFDLLRNTSSEVVLRRGVAEGPDSFLKAALVASTVDQDLFSDDIYSRNILSEGIPQFPDSKLEEIRTYVENSGKTFMDSRYLVNIVAGLVDVNIVVMKYNEDPRNLEYAFYESPVGTVPANVFVRLDKRKRTIVLLRRRYKTIPDQYDYLTTESSSLFDTAKVIDFLRTKIAILDLAPEIADNTSSKIRLVDLSQSMNMLTTVFKRYPVTYQTVDSVGRRIGSLHVINKKEFPIIHAYPLEPITGVYNIEFIQLLGYTRPSIADVISLLDIKKFTGAGYTKTVKNTYITSLLIEDVIILCQPALLNEDLEKFLEGTVEIETPDPYISRQFIEGEDLQTMLLKRKYGDVVVSFILQVMFTDALEYYVANQTFEDYGVLKRSSQGSSEPTMQILTLLVSKIKGLMGEIPPSPIQTLAAKEGFGALFSNDGVIMCYSDKMYKKLESQLGIFQRLIPALGITEVRGIPRIVRRIQGLYDGLVALARSRESFNGMGTLDSNDYKAWQDKCKTALESSSIYNYIDDGFFTTSREDPNLGFFGKKGVGLWVIQAKEGGKEYPVIEEELPEIVLKQNSTVPVFRYGSDNQLVLKRIV